MKSLISITLVIIYISLTVVQVISQDQQPIRIDTNLININVAVSDRKGKAVEGLAKENFEIFDDGKKQDVSHFSAENEPISFGIIYDMHPTTDARTKAVLESLRQFTKGLRDQDDFFTLVFNKRGSLTLEFVPNADQVRTHLSSGYDEPNALFDAIFAAMNKIRTRRNLKRVLLVITDSVDHNSEHRFNDILNQLKSIDVQIYSVLWDKSARLNYGDVTSENRSRIDDEVSNLDRAALGELALRTGGTINAPITQSARELFEIYTRIAAETRTQYTLGFYPAKLDGKTHNLRIKLRGIKNRKGMVLTYRTGYRSSEVK